MGPYWDGSWWGPHMFGFGWMWIFPLAFFIICLVFMFSMFRGHGWAGGHGGRHEGRESARDILDRRYASGEITKQQYDEMKAALGR